MAPSAAPVVSAGPTRRRSREPASLRPSPPVIVPVRRPVQRVGRVRQARRPLAVDHLRDQLADLLPRLAQGAPSLVGDGVVLAHLAADEPVLADEVPRPLQAVQDGVERARAELAAVPAQLRVQGRPVDRLLRGVVQDVDLDEAEEEVPEHPVSR